MEEKLLRAKHFEKLFSGCLLYFWSLESNANLAKLWKKLEVQSVLKRINTTIEIADIDHFSTL